MNLNKKHLENIIQANNNNRLAIFIGAGISKSSETETVKLPSWSDIINDLKNDLNEVEETDFLKIAQLYFLEFDEYTYYQKLKSHFPDDIEPSLIHKQIFDINPQVIITTNWDTLLEKTIEQNAYVYDVIASDKDLVGSTLQKKVIKMHGDFQNNNIVFKEDDYLSYSHNFPLIENYIKSILSTHTVLFLGYSYNDVNLKQIMKWLQNHSDDSPNYYLAEFNYQKSKANYLDNHNITLLVLDEENEKFTELHDSYTIKTASFLYSLVNPSQLCNNENDDDIIEYIYNKLKALDNLEGILLQQVRSVLTSCGFVYTDNNLILLKFYFNEMSYDFNEEIRAIHKKFIYILQNDGQQNTNEKLEKILDIFSKANIDGIIISEPTGGGINYIPINQYIKYKSIVNNCLDFEFNEDLEKTDDIHVMTTLAYQCYQIEDYENTYTLLEEIINLCLKQRNYVQLFIALFNKDVILDKLKFIFINQNKYKDIKHYDLKEKFINLPKDVQKTVEPIYDFINFNYLYYHAFNISTLLKKKKDAAQTVKKGGWVLHSNKNEASLQHKNLILFVLTNKIMIDTYSEYKTIIQDALEVSIVRQFLEQETWLNKVELYSCIKYFDNKELKQLFNSLYAEDTPKNFLNISNEDKYWLIEKVLPNLADIFIKHHDFFKGHEKLLINAIFLLSLINMKDTEIEKVMDIFLNIISKNRSTINFYEAINDFIGMQYYFFKTEFNKYQILNFIEIIVKKLAYGTYNGNDYFSITENRINNFYICAIETQVIFNNRELISNFLLEIQGFSFDKKTTLTETLLIKIYAISTQEIKDDISKYILALDIQDDLLFELLLVINNIKPYYDEFFEKVSIKLDEFEQQQSIEQANGHYTMSYFLDNLKIRLSYLINKMSISNLEPLLDKTNQLIKSRYIVLQKFKDFSSF